MGLQSCTSDDDDVVFRVLIYQFHIKVSSWFNPMVDINQIVLNWVNTNDIYYHVSGFFLCVGVSGWVCGLSPLSLSSSSLSRRFFSGVLGWEGERGREKGFGGGWVGGV